MGRCSTPSNHTMTNSYQFYGLLKSVMVIEFFINYPCGLSMVTHEKRKNGNREGVVVVLWRPGQRGPWNSHASTQSRF